MLNKRLHSATIRVSQDTLHLSTCCKKNSIEECDGGQRCSHALEQASDAIGGKCLHQHRVIASTNRSCRMLAGDRAEQCIEETVWGSTFLVASNAPVN